MAHPAVNKLVAWTRAAHAAGLMLSLPFLVPLHRLPLPSFESEWLALMLGLLVLGAAIVATRARQLDVPGVALAPVALAVVVLGQACGPSLAYTGDAVVVCGYLLWAAALMCAGRSAAAALGLAPLCRILAGWTLAGGLVSAVVGLLQYGQCWPELTGMLLAPAPVAGDGIYGNLAQQNHYATQVALAIGSAVYLYVTDGRARWQCLACVLPLVCVLLLSGSRSSFLYLACIALTWTLCRAPAPQRRWRTLALAGVCLVVAAALVIVAAHFSLLGPRSGRLLAFASGTGPRLFLWQHAWTMFTSHPVAGVGIDRFADVLISQLGERERMWGVDQYAHNLPLQLLAVTGVLGFAAVALPIGALMRRAAAARRGREAMWGYLVLGILCIHSMLEQPLFYSYFLGMAALAGGLMDTRATPVRPPAWARTALMLSLACGGVWLSSAALDYQTLSNEFYGAGEVEPLDQRHQQLLLQLHGRGLFAPMAELISPATFVPADAPVADRLALNTRLRRWAPIAEVCYRQAALLAEQGQQDSATLQFQQAARAYPGTATVYSARFAALADSDPGRFAALAAFAGTYAAAQERTGTGQR